MENGKKKRGKEARERKKLYVRATVSTRICTHTCTHQHTMYSTYKRFFQNGFLNKTYSMCVRQCMSQSLAVCAAVCLCHVMLCVCCTWITPTHFAVKNQHQKRSVFILLGTLCLLSVSLICSSAHLLICHTAVIVVSLISDLSVLLNVEALDSNKSDEVSIILHFLNNC